VRERLLPFIGLVGVLTAIPGPSIVLIMKSAVLGD
jgi:threonine/homoserine/homoserine lactone efflux protein